MKPYYEQDGITIYHGDCRLVVEDFTDHFGEKLFDLLLTDPPYGIGVAKTGRVGSVRRTKSNGFAVLDATDFGAVTWDGDTCADAIPAMRALARYHIIFGGNYYELPPSCPPMTAERALLLGKKRRLSPPRVGRRFGSGRT